MPAHYCAFDGSNCLAEGDLLSVAIAVKQHHQAGDGQPVIIFDAKTGRVTDVSLTGSHEDIEAWIRAHIPAALPTQHKSRGRPKLGVTSREVTLLPRQWDWLNAQPGGASVTLRKLVDQAAKDPRAEKREAQDATYRFATALAGDAPGFEEALRALYAGDQNQFEQLVDHWPEDVADHTKRLAQRVW